jgi:hypothetical protein
MRQPLLLFVTASRHIILIFVFRARAQRSALSKLNLQIS